MSAPIILTEDELIDFSLRVARFTAVVFVEPKQIPAYVGHLLKGSIEPQTCKKITDAIMREIQNPHPISNEPFTPIE